MVYMVIKTSISVLYRAIGVCFFSKLGFHARFGTHFLNKYAAKLISNFQQAVLILKTL